MDFIKGKRGVHPERRGLGKKPLLAQVWSSFMIRSQFDPTAQTALQREKLPSFSTEHTLVSDSLGK